jgi:hypothetical protein
MFIPGVTYNLYRIPWDGGDERQISEIIRRFMEAQKLAIERERAETIGPGSGPAPAEAAPMEITEAEKGYVVGPPMKPEDVEAEKKTIRNRILFFSAAAATLYFMFKD